MVPLNDQLCADPSDGASPFDRQDGSTPERSWLGPRESVPVILGMPAEFMRALEGLDAAGLTEGRLASAGGSACGSQLECAAHVAEVFHVTAKRLRLVFEQARTELTPTHNDSVTPSVHSASLPIVRAALVAAAANLAEAVNQGQPDAWALTASEGDRVVTAETLLHEALDDAHDHLHDLQRMVMSQ